VEGYCRFNGRLLIREEKSGFVVYMGEVPVSNPFADRGAGETWMSHFLGEQFSRRHVEGYRRFNGRLLIREEKSGFVVYMDEVPVSTPFADRGAGETWMSHFLGEQFSRRR
jgi:hypothetical protein